MQRFGLMGLDVTLVWLPGRIGFKGKEIADKCAKEITRTNHTDITVPFSKNIDEDRN